jgi:undecaprenyl pyrophosphate synthase
MRILRAIRNVKYGNETLDKGEVVFVTEENRIVQGPFMNKILQGYDCEFVDVVSMNQELLQKREELAGLMAACNRICDKLTSANTAINRLAIELSTEREEKALLLQTIENESMGRKPVVLPKEVAEAIEYYKNGPFGFTKYGILDAILHNSRKEDTAVRKMLKALNENEPWDILLEAIVNSYTVEQTPEEIFDQGVREICEKWANEQETSPVDLVVRVVGLARSVWTDKK